MYSVVGSDGQVYGPVDMPTLEQWVREGRIQPSTNMIDPIDGRVYRAQDLTLMASLFESAVRTATPPPPRPFEQTVVTAPVLTPTYARSMQPTSPKSKAAAIVLALFLGPLGIHRFYLGHNGTGVAMLLITLLTCGIGGIATSIWALIDVIMIATDSLKDVSGQNLS